MTEHTAKNGITFYRVNNDIYGNPRYVVHFLSFLGEEENGFALALKRAHEIGGSKYRGKDFGGGIVLESYNIDDEAKLIEEMRNK